MQLGNRTSNGKAQPGSAKPIRTNPSLICTKESFKYSGLKFSRNAALVFVSQLLRQARVGEEVHNRAARERDVVVQECEQRERLAPEGALGPGGISGRAPNV